MSARVSLASRVSVPDHVRIRYLGGESVVLSLETEKYYGLDEIGTRMWELLVGSGDVRSAYDRLLAEYDVAPDQLRADIERLVAELSAQRLLIVNE
jgi:hypothetical protein